jgi:hypothetical protein
LAFVATWGTKRVVIKYWRVTDQRNPSRPSFRWVLDDGRGPYLIHSDAPNSHPEKCLRGKTFSASIELFTGKNPKKSLSKFTPGEYYPRVWREHAWPNASEYYLHEWNSAVLGAKNLFAGMKDVFRYVEPETRNMNVYGHEIRQLLVLACNEVEAQCKAVLRANNYPSNRRQWNMKDDYFKLAKPLRLDNWQAQLLQYPKLGWIRPFRQWSRTTFRSLPWYAAYNKVKHDRELEFAQASLRNLVEAMAAVYILVVAQFGQFGRRSFNYQEVSEFGVRWPTFRLAEHYLPPHVESGAKWHSSPYPHF